MKEKSTMRLWTPVLVLAVLMFAVPPVHGQYKEMSKIDALARTMPEPDLLSSLSAHFNVPADTLKQEKSANNITYGQLYLAHAIAKSTKSDVGAILLESKSKVWPQIAKEKNVDLKQLSDDEDVLEKSIKKLQKTK
jgi:cell division protein FtsB